MNRTTETQVTQAHLSTPSLLDAIVPEAMLRRRTRRWWLPPVYQADNLTPYLSCDDQGSRRMPETERHEESLSPARSLAQRYVDTTNRGAYSEIGDLFAPDAIFLTPDGQELHGREEIRSFYSEFLPTITPKIRLASWFESGNECVFEIAARISGHPDEFLGAIDHFTVGPDGLASRLVVFTRPVPQP